MVPLDWDDIACTAPFGIPHEKNSNTLAFFFLGVAVNFAILGQNGWSRAGRESCFRARGGRVFAVHQSKQDNTLEWRSAANFHKQHRRRLWFVVTVATQGPIPWSESLSLNTQLNPNSATLLFSHFDMVSFRHMRTSHFKALLQGGELIMGTLWHLKTQLRATVISRKK